MAQTVTVRGFKCTRCSKSKRMVGPGGPPIPVCCDKEMLWTGNTSTPPFVLGIVDEESVCR